MVHKIPVSFSQLAGALLDAERERVEANSKRVGNYGESLSALSFLLEEIKEHDDKNILLEIPLEMEDIMIRFLRLTPESKKIATS